MIDVLSDQLVSFRQLADRLPRDHQGVKLHIATIGRWANHGRKGVRLEAVKIGRTRFTTDDAVRRFFAALGRGPVPTCQPSRAAMLANQELESIGL